MPETIAPRRRTAAVRRHRDENGDPVTSRQIREKAERDRAARAAWQAGKVVPHRITIALDLGQHYGPEVDEACDAHEPDVDQWEAGEKYPTWKQLRLLAELTGFDVRFFLMPDDGDIHALGPGVMFICKRSARNWNPVVEIPAPITEFTPEAIRATVAGYCVACLDGGQTAHTCEQLALFSEPLP